MLSSENIPGVVHGVTNVDAGSVVRTSCCTSVGASVARRSCTLGTGVVNSTKVSKNGGHSNRVFTRFLGLGIGAKMGVCPEIGGEILVEFNVWSKMVWNALRGTISGVI